MVKDYPDVMELKYKLLRFAGFIKDKDNDEIWWKDEQEFGGRWLPCLPDLVTFSDDQIEYLYPKLLELSDKFDGVEYCYDSKKQQWFCAINLFDDYGIHSVTEDELGTVSPQTAFALSMSKYIDCMEKENKNVS